MTQLKSPAMSRELPEVFALRLVGCDNVCCSSLVLSITAGSMRFPAVNSQSIYVTFGLVNSKKKGAARRPCFCRFPELSGIKASSIRRLYRAIDPQNFWFIFFSFRPPELPMGALLHY